MVLAVIIVLVQHRDLCIGLLLQDEFGKAASFADKAQIAAHRPRIMLRIAKPRGARTGTSAAPCVRSDSAAPRRSSGCRANRKSRTPDPARRGAGSVRPSLAGCSRRRE